MSLNIFVDTTPEADMENNVIKPAMKMVAMSELDKTTALYRAETELAEANKYHKKFAQFLLNKLGKAEGDALILALRLYGEDGDTFSPETSEVMARWRPRCEQAIREAAEDAALDSLCCVEEG